MEKEQNIFEVVTNGLQLSTETREKLAIEIRKAVLNELAKLDLKGDLVIKKLPKGREFINEIGPTEGIWTEYEEQ
jgi:hypothetical protein